MGALRNLFNPMRVSGDSAPPYYAPLWTMSEYSLNNGLTFCPYYNVWDDTARKFSGVNQRLIVPASTWNCCMPLVNTSSVYNLDNKKYLLMCSDSTQLRVASLKNYLSGTTLIIPDINDFSSMPSVASAPVFVPSNGNFLINSIMYDGSYTRFALWHIDTSNASKLTQEFVREKFDGDYSTAAVTAPMFFTTTKLSAYSIINGTKKQWQSGSDSYTWTLSTTTATVTGMFPWRTSYHRVYMGMYEYTLVAVREKDLDWKGPVANWYCIQADSAGNTSMSYAMTNIAETTGEQLTLRLPTAVPEVTTYGSIYAVDDKGALWKASSTPPDVNNRKIRWAKTDIKVEDGGKNKAISIHNYQDFIVVQRADSSCIIVMHGENLVWKMPRICNTSNKKLTCVGVYAIGGSVSLIFTYSLNGNNEFVINSLYYAPLQNFVTDEYAVNKEDLT